MIIYIWLYAKEFASVLSLQSGSVHSMVYLYTNQVWSGVKLVESILVMMVYGAHVAKLSYVYILIGITKQSLPDFGKLGFLRHVKSNKTT
jgi:hypothetical protein